MVGVDLFNLEVYFCLCSGAFLVLLSALSLSLTRVIRKFPRKIFCCHSTDFIIASRCVLCPISARSNDKRLTYKLNKTHFYHSLIREKKKLSLTIIKIIFVPSGNDKTGWKLGSTSAILSCTVNCSRGSCGCVGSSLPVHSVQTGSEWSQSHLTVEALAARFDVSCSLSTFRSFLFL